MTDQLWVQAILGLMAVVFLWQVLSKKFDPFAPVWMFMVGYVQIYVIQAITLRDWALAVRGPDVVEAANFRAFWALAWYLVVYYTGIGKPLSAAVPRPPEAWSNLLITLLGPVLSVFGIYCAYLVMNWGNDPNNYSPEAALLTSFPFVTMVGAILLIVGGRHRRAPRPDLLAAGLLVAAAFVVLWMFNGKRSPALIGVLASVCAFYITRGRRPSWAVLLVTAFVGSLCVAVAINWRFNKNHYEKSAAGFVEFLGEFQVSSILASLNVENEDEKDHSKYISQESLEYGGFLLMLDTVPEKSGYDYGCNYLRCVSTFIPRFLWPDKPLFGREQWVGAWIEGSEMKRDETFTGPAIGIMGATQLNGGALGTMIVIAVVALMQRTGYEYFLRHAHVPWVQAWWSLTYYCAWYQVVADDPMNWFYYNWGFTTMPPLALLWIVLGLAGRPAASHAESHHHGGCYDHVEGQGREALVA